MLVKWLGNIAIIAGLWTIGNKWKHAFLFSIVGESCWMYASAQSGDWALFTICAIFNVMALRNWIKWNNSPS